MLLNRPLHLLDELNAASIRSTPEVISARRDRLNIPRRLAYDTVATPMFQFIHKHPQAWRNFYSKIMVLPGYRYINSGNEQTVIALDSTVIKIDRHSQMISGTERNQRLQYKHKLFAAAGHYLGRHLLPQTLNIEIAPLRHKPISILTRQAFIQPTVADLVHQKSSSVRKQIVAAGIEPKAIASELAEFLYQSENLRKREGLLPDVGGLGNLIVASARDKNDSQIVLLDSGVTDEVHRQSPSAHASYNTVEQEHSEIIDRLWQLCETL